MHSQSDSNYPHSMLDKAFENCLQLFSVGVLH